MSAWWLETEKQTPRRRTRNAIALALAVGASVGTVCFPSVAMLSQSPIVSALQQAATYLLFPGIIGSMAISGNVHAFSLWVAAVINAAIYFGLVWLAASIANQRKPKPALRVK